MERVANTLVRRRGVYFMVMEHETLVGLSGNPVFDDGLAEEVGDSRPEQPVRACLGRPEPRHRSDIGIRSTPRRHGTPTIEKSWNGF